MSLSYAFIGLLVIFFIIFPVSADLKVHFLDVNEGDAVLLQADGKNMLIDAGTANSGNLTKYYLHSLGITTLDQVLLTSPEEGKSGALTNILNTTPTREYFDGGWNVSDGSYRDVLTMIDEENISHTTVRKGNEVPFAEGVNISIISSEPDGNTGAETLIPLITYGNIRFLLMGKEQTVPGNVSAQILRVADHGSRQGTDPGFVMNVHPDIAIVSSGDGNPDGNPNQNTLNILQTVGAKFMRTDIDGTITISTDGTIYSVGNLRMEPEITLSLVSVVETRAPV
ncbi:ComEC/Rec2 family competence protein [Methanospirillum lacunae]|uniref:Metallo-beta-lactamase domain-containing protein n=1 Tax=Methanospirillum lacunae TaxID=668570 RepID=A0A2V2ND39_9EURY|nr:hypothetical protein [Methanospirillum lacunae]PWR74277.1 hypothetical protein DK846_03790 [Methanospirillum lacunae]